MDRHDFKMTDASRRLLEGRGTLSFEERNAQLLRKKEARMTMRVDPEEAELAECTWKPALNRHSLAIAGDRRRRDLIHWALVRSLSMPARTIEWTHAARHYEPYLKITSPSDIRCLELA
jgi:hypothetical protein